MNGNVNLNEIFTEYHKTEVNFDQAKDLSVKLTDFFNSLTPIDNKTTPIEFEAQKYHDNLANFVPPNALLNSMTNLGISEAFIIDPNNLVGSAQSLIGIFGETPSHLWAKIAGIPEIFKAMSKMGTNCDENPDNYKGCKHYINNLHRTNSAWQNELPSGIYCQAHQGADGCKDISVALSLGVSMFDMISGLVGSLGNIFTADFSAMLSTVLVAGYAHYMFDNASYPKKATFTLTNNSRAVGSEVTDLGSGSTEEIGAFADVEYIALGTSGRYTAATAYIDIFLIRALLDFAAGFSIAEVNSIASALAGVPFVGPALMIMFRLGVAVVNASTDMALMVKGGQKVPFMQNTQNWTITSIAEPKSGFNLGYADYLALIMLLKFGDEDARMSAVSRIGDVLQAKMFYYLGSDQSVNADERGYFAKNWRLENCITDIQVRANLRVTPFFISIIPTDYFHNAQKENPQLGIYRFSVNTIGGY
jgi:hypothetical protein